MSIRDLRFICESNLDFLMDTSSQTHTHTHIYIYIYIYIYIKLVSD